MAVSLDKDWTRVNLTLCAETRSNLESWKLNGISLPTALATCTRLVYADGMSPLHTPRGKHRTGSRSNFRRMSWTSSTSWQRDGKSAVPRAADRILQIGAEAVETGANTQMSIVMPLEKEEI